MTNVDNMPSTLNVFPSLLKQPFEVGFIDEETEVQGGLHRLWGGRWTWVCPSSAATRLGFVDSPSLNCQMGLREITPVQALAQRKCSVLMVVMLLSWL